MEKFYYRVFRVVLRYRFHMIGVALVLCAPSVQALSPENLLNVNWSQLEDTVYVEKLEAQALEAFNHYPLQEIKLESLALKPKSDLPWKTGEVVSRDARDKPLLIERRFLGEASVLSEQCQAWLQDFYFATDKKYSAPYQVNCDLVKPDMDSVADTLFSEDGQMIYHRQELPQDFGNKFLHNEQDQEDQEGGEREKKFLEWHWYPSGEAKALVLPTATYYFSREGLLVGLDQRDIDRSFGSPNETLTYNFMIAGWYRNGQLKFLGYCYSYPCDSEQGRDSLWHEWYDNGQPYRQIEYAGTWEFGIPRRAGEELHWHKNGQLQKRVLYKHRENDEVQSWYANGQLVQSCDEAKEQCTSWYENAQIMMQGKTKKYSSDSNDRFRTGEWLGFYEDGKPFMRSYYDHVGRKAGTWHFWYPNGQLRYEMKFAISDNDDPNETNELLSILHWDKEGNAARLPGVLELVDMDVSTAFFKQDKELLEKIMGNAFKFSVRFPSGGLIVAQYFLHGLTSEGYYVLQEFYDDDLSFWSYFLEQPYDALDIEKELQVWENYNPFSKRSYISPPLSEPYVRTDLPEVHRNQWGYVWEMPEHVVGELVLWYTPEGGGSADSGFPIDETTYDARRDDPHYAPYDSTWWRPSTYMLNGSQKWIQADYENGQLHGSWQVWYSNGLPAQQGQYVQGKRDGVWTQWDHAGFKECEVTFMNGKPVEDSWRFWNVYGELLPFVNEDKEKEIDLRFRGRDLYGWQGMGETEPKELMQSCLIL